MKTLLIILVVQGINLVVFSILHRHLVASNLALRHQLAVSTGGADPILGWALPPWAACHWAVFGRRQLSDAALYRGLGGNPGHGRFRNRPYHRKFTLVLGITLPFAFTGGRLAAADRSDEPGLPESHPEQLAMFLTPGP